ncbi:MAG: c-type cytochrome [Rhizobiales bacterium]|nr:c-type cytochrome [Hyphomicrobiales bacterium]
MAMRRLMEKAGLPIVLVAGMIGIAWTLMAREHPPGDPGDPEQVALGAALYAWNCARCHGEDLGGELGWAQKQMGLSDQEIQDVAKRVGDVAPAHDAHGDTARLADDKLFAVIHDGPEAALGRPQSRMSGFKDQLAEDEIWAIIAFLKSHWPEAGSAGASTLQDY